VTLAAKLNNGVGQKTESVALASYGKAKREELEQENINCIFLEDQAAASALRGLYMGSFVFSTLCE
jgi:hypothetical protein